MATTRTSRRMALAAACLVPAVLWYAQPGYLTTSSATRGLRTQLGASSTSVALDDLPPAAKAWADANFVDESKELAAHPFPFAPQELVARAKRILALNIGFPGEVGGLMAEDFEFAGPVVGPLSKKAYLDAIKGFDLLKFFPDSNFEMYDFRVDPFEPNRVWFTSRGKGTQTGSSKDSPFFSKATGKSYVNPPQACSFTFNEQGLVNQYTIGYVMDRRVGNTGGLGGIYGILYAVGKPFPFPEAQPHKPSLRMRMFNALGRYMTEQKAKKEKAKA
ncbi:unnamed protein product [Polarella glacialis]|uniref:PS II complex 12 kDa extrinsic protein n=1 Tax=Polarella glacialis TaxID=89957 RepID=A0A813E6G2_POLGL|nr:unnamed protein product [Polarella glacialis]